MLALALLARVTLAALDARIAADRARLAAVEAPIVRLTAAADRLSRIASSPERDRQLVSLGGTLALMAPEAMRETGALHDHLALLATQRAQPRLEELLRERERPRMVHRTLTAPVSACPDAAYQPPVEGDVVPARVAAALGQARGLTLVGAPAASTTAPASGRIAYAGPFRHYGGIVILDHGHGWTSLVTGLRTVAVRADMWVPQGLPLGRVDAARPLVEVELTHHGRAVDALAMMRRCARQRTGARPFPPGAGRTTEGANR